MTPGSWQLSGHCTQAHHLSSSCGQQALSDMTSSSSGTWRWTWLHHLWLPCCHYGSARKGIWHFLKSGPRIHGICLIRDSEARKASFFLATSMHCQDSILVPFPHSILRNWIYKQMMARLYIKVELWPTTHRNQLKEANLLSAAISRCSHQSKMARTQLIIDNFSNFCSHF